jgi:WD40 repeat protein
MQTFVGHTAEVSSANFSPDGKQIVSASWDNKPPKIKREVILQKANQGGLNITDIYTYSKSVKFQWVKKLLDSSFAQYFHFINCNFHTW